MRPPAHVTSLDLLRDWLAALATFRAEAHDALTSAQLDVRHAFDWLTEAQKSWQRAIRERQDEVTAAKAALTRKKWVLPGQREPDITEEVKALRLAQRRLAEAEDKLACTRRWQPALHRAADEFDGPIRRLADLLDGQLPRAGERLDRMLRDLEAYLAVRAGAPSPSHSTGKSQ